MKLLVILIGLCSICLSCQTHTGQTEPQYIKELTEAKKITLPIDENSYYHSRYMFQFEEGENELLVFQNTEKGTHKIKLLYSILKIKRCSRKFQLTEEGLMESLG